MRIQSLSIIASFLFLSLAITSCLDSDNNYELGSDDTITAFALDTIYGVDYKFTIDQLNREIYNIDSIPFSADTIIDKILIKTLTCDGWIVTGDSLFVLSDSVNFKNSMDTPLEFTVYAPNGETSRTYKIKVNRHRIDPDSLVWGNTYYTQSFSGSAVTATQKTKAVTLGDDIFLFASDGTNTSIYKGPSQNQWELLTHNLPAGTGVESALAYQGKLHIIGGDGDIHCSEDGITWIGKSAYTDWGWTTLTFEKLITTFQTKDSDGNMIDQCIAAILTDDTGTSFATATYIDGALTWKKGQEVPPGFPDSKIVATKSFTTTTGMQRAMLVGEIDGQNPKPTKTTPWFSMDGLNWAAMESDTKYIPQIDNPSIIYYGNLFYAFGGDFTKIYSSVNGLVWEEVEKQFLFPEEFAGRTGYAMTIDDKDYIWMIFGTGVKEDQVWRGRQNKLIQ